jgi:LPXTG-site transpeptidase (sortase) family protein
MGFVLTVFVVTVVVNITTDLPDSKLGQAALPHCIPSHTSCSSGDVFQHYENCNGEIIPCEYGCKNGACKDPPTGECDRNSDCSDGDPCTTDMCREAGQPSSFCESFDSGLCNETPEVDCDSDGDCNDHDSCTTDKCRNPGKLNAFCENFWNFTCDNGGGGNGPTPAPCSATQYGNGVCANLSGGNLRGGNCKNASDLGGEGRIRIDVLNSGSGRMHIIWNLFRSDTPGCAPTIDRPSPGGSKSGTCSFDAPRQSGTCTVKFDTSAVNCGRVQYDGAFSDGGGMFIGAMIDYGIHCDDVEPTPGPETPTPTPPPGNNPPGGFLDAADCVRIAGWAKDPDSPDTPVTVEIWLDGTRGAGQLYKTVIANLPRADVGNHAYHINIPPEDIDGLTHNVYAYALDNEHPTTVWALLTNSPINVDTSACLDPCALVSLDAQFSENLSANELATSVSAITTGDTDLIEVCYQYPPDLPDKTLAIVCEDITSTGFDQRLWTREAESFSIDTVVRAYAAEELCASEPHTFLVPPPEPGPCELFEFNAEFDGTLTTDELVTDVTATWSGGDPVVEVCYTEFPPDADPLEPVCYDMSDGADQRTWERLVESYSITSGVSATVDGEICETAAFGYDVPGINATPTPTPSITPTPTPTTTPTPQYKLTKYVRNDTLNDPIFRYSTEASPEDIVEFSIWVRGLQGTVRDVMLYDILPDGLEYIPGTIRITGNTEGSGDLFLYGNRLSLGDLTAGGRITLLFKAKVADEDFFPEGRTTLVNTVRSTTSNAPPQTAEAIVIVERVGPGDIKTGPPRNFYGPFIFDRDAYKRAAYTLPIDTLDPIYDQEIFIPAIGVRVPIIQPSQETQASVYNSLNDGAVIYPDSADYGEHGNTVILGHSFNFPWLGNEYTQIFSYLDKLEEGDIIRVVSDGEVYKYAVSGSQILSVKEANHVVAESTDTNTLHLLSCWPVGSSLYRIVVSAELIE